MSSISKFTVESQVQHYASLTFTPHRDTGANEYYLTPESLPNFINAAEWSLGKELDRPCCDIMHSRESTDIWIPFFDLQ